MLVNLVLWIGGLAFLALGVAQARAPYARLRGLRAADENVRRYEDWRGRGPRDADRGTTGADVMRQLLTTRLRLWTAVGLVGFVLIVAGFVIR